MKRPNSKVLILGSLAIALVIAAIAIGLQTRSTPEKIDIVSLVQQVETGKVSSIVEDANGHSAMVHFKDESVADQQVRIPSGTSLAELFKTANIPVSQWPTMDVSTSSTTSQLSSGIKIALILVVIGGVVLIIRRTQSGIGRSSSRKGAFDPIRPGDRSVLMSDVAGSEEVKEEIADVIDFLKDPEKFHRLGARIPRGALLVGPPGTGKTLLARAVAGEAQASFFSVSGSEFVELYVGVGASRVRELFRRARECAPAIIFIDEIDSIGRKRGRAEHSTEYDQTLNQILVEMDGFDQRSTVVVLAATNRADILDSALLRPGRFDRRVHVDLPDRAARSAILRVHSRGKPIADGVDLDEMAARTTGMSGADLANVMNEAAILTARRNADVISLETLLESIDRTMAGAARKGSRFSDREREIIAYHEAGHALVAHFLPHADTVRKVSIVSRGRAGGYTMIIPEEDRGLWTRQQLTDRLAALLGGYAAEEIIFGEVTTGSSNDLEQVSSITISMVARYGMGQSFGLLSAGEDGTNGSAFSQRTAFAAESEARDIVNEAHMLARTMLIEHRADLEALSQRLLEVETVEGSQLIEMFGPAVTAAPRAKRPVTTLSPIPERTIRPLQRQRKSTRLERLTAIPAAIIAGASARRRQTP
jgi:cell division protease FtsH